MITKGEDSNYDVSVILTGLATFVNLAVISVSFGQFNLQNKSYLVCNVKGDCEKVAAL